MKFVLARFFLAAPCLYNRTGDEQYQGKLNYLKTKNVLMAVHAIPLWLLILLILPLFALLIKRQMEAKKQSQLLLPPSPPKLPILGNLHQLGPRPHQSMWKLSKKFGPVMLLQLGRIPAVVISSAEAAREVLKVHDLACCSRPVFEGSARLSHNYLDVAFTPYGEYWRHVRKIVVLEVFSLKRVQSFSFIREEELGLLINSISQSSFSAAPVNLTEKLFALAANITFKMSFGFNYHGTEFEKGRFHEVIHEAEAVMGSISANEYFPYFGWIIDRLTGHNERRERVFHQLNTFFQHVIDDHLKPERKSEHEDLIDVLLRIEKEHAGSDTRFTKENIKALLLNQFLGGIDANAITLNWAMAELVRNPRLMKKAQEEVRKCVGNKGKVTEGDIDQLEYLKMVIKETLRLHLPAPLLLPRQTISDCKINDYDILSNKLLYINAWAIGRDPACWEDPEEFIPERFADSSVDFKGQNFEFLPFGSGRRICPGITMATTTVHFILANLLYCFDWKLPFGMKEEDICMEEKAGVSLTVSKKDDLILVPVKYVV